MEQKFFEAVWKFLQTKAGLITIGIILLCMGVCGFTLTSCSTTKATIMTAKDSANTTITITTNNPQQVDAKPSINAELKKGE